MNQNSNMRTDVPDIMTDTPREAVRNIQRYLRRLSYVYPDIPSVPVDGIFNTATRDSLSAFQRKFGLPVTGVADEATWELLYTAYLDVLFGASEPAGLPIFPLFPVDYTVRRGDENFLVSAVQFLLREISTLYDFPLTVELTGLFDDRTERAVIEAQRLFLLPPTGEVDKRLWNYLVGAYRAEDSAREQT